MKQSWIVAKRELSVFFDSLMAYIILVLFLGMSGFFTWLFPGSGVFESGQANLGVFFQWAYWTLFIFIPAITMRMIAEEKRSGTIELLLTKPVSDWQFVSGKFISALILVCFALLLTLPYYFTVWHLGKVDHGAVLAGYLGLVLMSAAYISIGIFASSITSNQIVAFLLTLFIGIFFHLVLGLLAQVFPGVPGKMLNYLSMQYHFESISRGVIDTKDLVYFITIIFAGLIASESVLARRNVADQ
ncbi:MAG: ABC transporter permease subunit [Bacteroidales bacterium]